MENMRVLVVLCSFFCMFNCSEKNNKTDNNLVSESKGENVEIPLIKHKQVVFGDFNLELKTNGKVFAKRKVDLEFILNEKITKIYVSNGQKVKAGQIIAQQNKDIYVNKVVKAKEQLERAKIDVEDILIGFSYSLKDSTKIPSSTLSMAMNRSNFNSSLSNLNDAKIELSSTVLKAPFDGVIANLNTKEHSFPDKNNPFCSVIDNSTLDVEFKILEDNFAFISVGLAIEVDNEFIEKKVVGKITEINPTVDDNGMISIKGSFENTDYQILDGMNVNIVIKKLIPNKIYIPKECVVLRDNKKIVFTYEEGKAIWNYVETSFENSEYIIIDSGLKKTDNVIYSGNVNLAHNSNVSVAE